MLYDRLAAMSANLTATPTERIAWLNNETVPLSHRALWRLLDESDTRIGELLGLDVPDLALDDLMIKVRDSKEGPVEVDITAETAVALRQLVGTRTEGPVFTTPAGARLSPTQAAEVFRTATGMSLHVLRNDRRRRAAIKALAA
ncbi:hypothetical protein [Streptomyces sp. NPDC049555]|uniref:hypothetical protein n=1 Tax=Streptomyces sp. NPDC049555 TaxID=3154930 RepID=UPI00343CABE7